MQKLAREELEGGGCVSRRLCMPHDDLRTICDEVAYDRNGMSVWAALALLAPAARPRLHDLAASRPSPTRTRDGRGVPRVRRDGGALAAQRDEPAGRAKAAGGKRAASPTPSRSRSRSAGRSAPTRAPATTARRAARRRRSAPPRAARGLAPRAPRPSRSSCPTRTPTTPTTTRTPRPAAASWRDGGRGPRRPRRGAAGSATARAWARTAARGATWPSGRGRAFSDRTALQPMVTRKATTVAAAAVETVANQFTSRAAASRCSRTRRCSASAATTPWPRRALSRGWCASPRSRRRRWSCGRPARRGRAACSCASAWCARSTTPRTPCSMPATRPSAAPAGLAATRTSCR